MLRRFELALLAELGYALPLTREVDTGAPIDPAARYHYAFDRGPQRVAGDVAAEPGARRAAGARRDAARARRAAAIPTPRPRRRRSG